MRFIFALALSTIAHCEAARVYYVNQPELLPGQINSVKPDGTSHTTLWTAAQVTDLRGIDVDPANSRLFFAHAKQDVPTLARTEVSLRALSTNGGVPSIVTNFADGLFLGDVEWEPASNWVYVGVTGALQLRRVRPDGSLVETVLTHIASGQGPYFFCLDTVGQNAYWAIGTNTNDVNTAYSRGSIATGVVDASWSLVTVSRTRDIAIDRTVPGGRLYWCDRQEGTVYTREAESGVIQRVLPRRTLNAPHGLVLDIEAGRAYVADTGKRGDGLEASSHRVVRFKMDGTGVVEFLSPASLIAEPWDLAIDTTTTSYADWSTRFFAFNAPNAAPDDDPDGDNRNNAAEYAFFTNPERKDSALDNLKATGTGIRFARRLVSDATLRVEVSTDLAVWHWNGDTTGTIWTVELSTEVRDGDSQWVNVGPAPALVGAP